MGEIANRMLIEAIFKAKEKLKEKKKNENRKQSENDGKQKKIDCQNQSKLTSCDVLPGSRAAWPSLLGKRSFQSKNDCE